MRDPGNEVVTFVFFSLDFNTKYFFYGGPPFCDSKIFDNPFKCYFLRSIAFVAIDEFRDTP